MASVNPEFGATMARCLNQSRVSAVPRLNLITIKFGTAEARRLNWALVLTTCSSTLFSKIICLVIGKVFCLGLKIISFVFLTLIDSLLAFS